MNAPSALADAAAARSAAGLRRRHTQLVRRSLRDALRKWRIYARQRLLRRCVKLRPNEDRSRCKASLFRLPSQQARMRKAGLLLSEHR
ncbi:MAG: hypothetical protein NZL99_04995 [Burkholderiaceae bacterium]|nr:hypothetical protein [Burkholderiaceae bacterium]